MTADVVAEARRYAEYHGVKPYTQHIFALLNKIDRLGSQLGNGVVAVQNGEPEEIVLGMLRGELKFDYNAIVSTGGNVRQEEQ